MYERNSSSVLIVSSSQKVNIFLSELLPTDKFSPILTVSTAGEARRLLVDRDIDIVVINSPLSDDFGVELAIEASEDLNCGVLIFVKAELQDNVSERVEGCGILTLSKPVSRQLVYQSMNLLVAARQKIKALEEKTSTLQGKMEEIRLVNRAKLLLIEHLKMSEPEAHRYIEKTAMDACVKRRKIAEDIIRTYEN
ncbi:MAG TPA: ANTAR domain-containing protein [Firmicutes bacterium]|nr:ANTAR domain-containing protein [Bacillota bacterium]